jgi:hypothetical protein
VQAGERVAQVAHEWLDPGPMGWDVREAEYLAFIDASFDDSPTAPVYRSGGTNCAIFVRGCWVQAEVAPRGERPSVTGIESWLGKRFTGRGWLRYDGTGLVLGKAPDTGLTIYGEPEPGDCFYICSNAGQLTVNGKTYTWSTWRGALNGHVGLVGFDGEGWLHTTYEGGGPHHLCRKSAVPKDLRRMGRTLQGVLRPSLF